MDQISAAVVTAFPLIIYSWRNNLLEYQIYLRSQIENCSTHRITTSSLSLHIPIGNGAKIWKHYMSTIANQNILRFQVTMD